MVLKIMKYILFLLWAMYIIWAISAYIFFTDNNNTNIVNPIDSIVIIIPENKIINYNKNPGWLITNYEKTGLWLWFFTSSNWIIQTVNHLVKNNTKYKVFYNNKYYPAQIISRNLEKDLANLKIDFKNSNFLEISKDINDNNITSYGLNTNNLEIIKLNWKILNKKSKLVNKTNLLEISTELQPGFSGWPIINSKWKVIWINYAISNWKNYWITFVNNH